MLSRDHIKATLQRFGLFPFARAAYRALSTSVRTQKAKEINFYRPLLKPNCLCFDVGANLGQKAEVFLSCGARVVIIEPNVLCLPTLQYLFGKNPNAQIVSAAVGSSPGSITLHVHGTDGTASIRPEWDQQLFGVNRSMASLTVPVTTLDDLIERFGRPDFVKIDVEGFELDVLRGLSSTVPLLSVEYFSKDINRLKDCLELLSKRAELIVRPSNMNCDWLGPEMRDIDGCLHMLQSANASGDLFVWLL